MFPQIDARLIKATVLDGDDMDSAIDFLTKESMQSYEYRPDRICSPASDYVCVNDLLITPDAKKHHVALDPDEYRTDFDKHEESIVWKGGLKSNVPRDAQINDFDDSNFQQEAILPGNHGQGNQQINDFDDSNFQQEAILPGNQRIDWWATTWPTATGTKSDGDMYNSSSNSSVHSNSDTQDAAGILMWLDTEQYKSIPQKFFLQEGPNVDIDYSSTGSTQSLMLEKENSSLWSPARDSNKFDKSCKSLGELALPLSQESFKVLDSEACMLEADRSISRSGNNKHSQPSVSCLSDGNDNISSCQSVNIKNVGEDNVVQEVLPESSRYNINIEDLDKFVDEAKRGKENVRKEMGDIYLLRQKAEQAEMAAQHAKTEAASSGLEIFLKVEDMRQQVTCQRTEYEMRAAEVYGEKSVLAMEARELKGRLVETQAERAKALSLLDSIRRSLSARLEKASQEKQCAIEEAEMKVKKAKELLAWEQASAQKLEQSFKTLEAEAETCKKLREFLIERGNIVDSLQGEMAVLCEDVLTFKEQVDEGIPLSSGSRSLSWSRMSHMTEQILLESTVDIKDCGASRCTPLETSAWLNSMSSTSILTLSSATSEVPKSVRPIECGLRSQYFSPESSMVGTADKNTIEERTMGGQKAGEEMVESVDTMAMQQEKEKELNSASSSGRILHEQQEKEELHSASSGCSLVLL